MPLLSEELRRPLLLSTMLHCYTMHRATAVAVDSPRSVEIAAAPTVVTSLLIVLVTMAAIFLFVITDVILIAAVVRFPARCNCGRAVEVFAVHRHVSVLGPVILGGCTRTRRVSVSVAPLQPDSSELGVHPHVANVQTVHEVYRFECSVVRVHGVL